jgi:hypothetical protein
MESNESNAAINACAHILKNTVNANAVFASRPCKDQYHH